MEVSYSELILLNNDVYENVKKLKECGTNKVEVLMDAAGWNSFHGDYTELIKKLKSLGVQYSVHPAAWDINLTAEMDILREAAYQHHLDALKFSAELGASQMVVHPGFCYSPCFSKETAKKRAHETILKLAEEAKKVGVKLAFENVGYNGASIYTEEEYLHSLDGVDPIVGYLIDTGHANVNGWNIPKMIDTVSGRLFGLHIHDNGGRADSHLPIGKGNSDWEGIFSAMRRIKSPECEFILEYAPKVPLEFLSEGKEILEKELNK